MMPFDPSIPAGRMTLPTEAAGLSMNCVGLQPISWAFRIAWTANFGKVTLRKTLAREWARSIICESIVGSVTSIGTFAFSSNNLTSVTLGAPLASIGYSAFNTNDLTTVTFPPTLVSLGSTAFIGNPDLTSFVFTGAPPTTFTPAGPTSSLGTASGIVVGYLTGLGAAETAGGFGNPWQGFATQELVTTTYDLDGHGAQLDPALTPIGDSPTEPSAPTEAHWMFKGWYTDSALTTRADFTDPLTTNQTLFARWDPELAVTGQTINYSALWAAILSASLGTGLVLVSRRRRHHASRA